MSTYGYTDAPAGVPMWKHKLQTKATFYKECHQEGNLDKFFEVYPIPQVLQARVLALIANPTSLTDAPPAPEPSGLPASITGPLKEHADQMVAEHKAGADKVQAMADQLKADPNPDKNAWKAKLNKKREETKDLSVKSIDDTFNNVIATIETLPEANRDAAADFWDFVNSGFLGFWNGIWKGLEKIFDAVVQWLSNMWETIKAAWNTVQHGFEDAGHWISSLF